MFNDFFCIFIYAKNINFKFACDKTFLVNIKNGTILKLIHFQKRQKMKKIITESIMCHNSVLILFLILVCTSCGQKQDKESTANFSSSFEISPENDLDTINIIVNGLKQGKWVVKKNDIKETVYYRNDTLIE